VIAPILRFRSAPVRNELEERRANLEAALAFVMVVLLLTAIVRAEDVRRFSDRTVAALEQSVSSVDDIRHRLYLVYGELQRRSGAR
jgi:hypothetical protein